MCFFVLTVVLFCLGFGILNYTVNPFGFYAPHLVRQLTWDEVQLKTRLMRQQPSPDIMILGSSRVMTIDPEDIQSLTGYTAFNAGTGAAAPLDSCAVFRYALEGLHWHPRELILGIDVNGFNHPFANQAVLVTPELSPYLPRAAKWAGLWERWNVLLSTGQISSSLKSLRLARRRTGYPPPSVRFAANGLALLPAGEQWEDRNLPEAVRFWSLQDAEFTRLSVDQQQSFEEILQFAVDRNIKVVGYVTPFHPSLLQGLKTMPHFNTRRQELLTYLNHLGRRFPNFSYQDLTDISSFGGTAAGFYDFIHIRRENGRLILKRIL